MRHEYNSMEFNNIIKMIYNINLYNHYKSNRI